MELREAQNLALRLMSEHVIPSGVMFRWNNAVNMLGQATHNRMKGLRYLELSRKMTAVCDEESVRDTILHEIAHLNAGLENGHNRVWKLEAMRIGASPERTANPATTPNIRQDAAPWRGTCPNGHSATPMWRKPRVSKSCGKCSSTYNPAYRITYRHVDTGAVFV